MALLIPLQTSLAAPLAKSAVQPLPAREQRQITRALNGLRQLKRWPNPSPESGPLQLSPCIVLFGEKAQWLLGCEYIPKGLQQVPGQRFMGKPVYWTSQALYLPHVRVNYPLIKTTVVGQGLLYMPQVPASKPYRDQPWFLIQRQQDLKRYHPAFKNITDVEWTSLFVHEAFHMLMQLPEPGIAAQMALAGKPQGHIPYVDQEDLKRLYRETPGLQRMLFEEHKLLSTALHKNLSPDEATQALKDWWQLYQGRIQRLGAGFKGTYGHWDAFWTFLEGSARYVESRFLLEQLQKNRYSDLPAVNHSIAAHYYYSIGMHLAFLMDRIDPQWPAKVYQHPRWLVGLVEERVHEALD